MSSRNPFEEVERLFERLSRQFEEASRDWDAEGPLAEWRSGVEAMAVDLVEHDGEFVVTVDLPGFDRDDVDVQVTDHTLTIEAEHEEEATEEGDEREEGRYLRHERRRESTRRSIRLPDAVDTGAVTARMNNGVLTVTLPKVDADTGRSIEVE